MIEQGSRVRFVFGADNFGLTQGQETVVTEISQSGTYVRVEGQTARTKLNVRYFEEIVPEPEPVAPPPPVVNVGGMSYNNIYGCCGFGQLYMGGRSDVNPASLEAFLTNPTDEEGEEVDDIHNGVIAILNERQFGGETRQALEAQGFEKVCETQSNYGVPRMPLHVFIKGIYHREAPAENARQF